jgi:succinate dehydrogenase/fumarate reductase flavoprotein subunit
MFITREPIKFSDEIQELMNQNARIVREERRLKHGLKRILELKNEFYSKDNILKESISMMKILLVNSRQVGK